MQLFFPVSAVTTRTTLLSLARRGVLCAVASACVTACGDGGGSPDTARDDVGDAGADSALDVMDDGGDAVSDPDTDGGDAADAGDATADAAGDPTTDTSPDAGDRSFTSSPPSVVEVGTDYTYVPTVTFDPAQFALAEGPDGATFAGETLTWAAPEDAAEVDFALDALFEGEVVATQRWQVRVRHAPQFGNEPDANATVGDSYVWVHRAFDVDDDLDRVELTEAPTWMTFDGVTAWGTPEEAGSARVVARATDLEGLTTELAFDILVRDPVLDLRLDRAWIDATEVDLAVFGCCFEDDAAWSVVIGGLELDATRVNAGRLELSTPADITPGEYDVVVLADGVPIGRLAERFLILPFAYEAPVLEIGEIGTRSDDVAFMTWSPSPAAALPVSHPDSDFRPDRVRLDDSDALGVAARVGRLIGQVVPGLPTSVFDIDGMVLFDVDPLRHVAGDTVELTLNGTADAVSVRWDTGEATASPSGFRRWSARVPASASGALTVIRDGVPIDSVVDAAVDDDVPRLTMAHVTALPRRESLVLVRGLGLDHPAIAWVADRATVRVVSRADTEALLAIAPDPGAQTVDLRATVGGASSRVLPLLVAEDPIDILPRRTVGADESPSTAPGTVGIGAGPIVRVGTADDAAELAVARGGAWVRTPRADDLGVSTGGDGDAWWFAGPFGEPGTAALAADVDAVWAVDTQGVVHRRDRDGDESVLGARRPLGAIGLGEDARAIALSGVTQIALSDGVLVAAHAASGTVLAVAPDGPGTVLGLAVDPGRAEPLAAFPPAASAYAAIGPDCISVFTDTAVHVFGEGGALVTRVRSPLPVFGAAWLAGDAASPDDDRIVLADTAGGVVFVDAPGGCADTASLGAHVAVDGAAGRAWVSRGAEGAVVSWASGGAAAIDEAGALSSLPTGGSSDARPGNLLDAWRTPFGLRWSDGATVLDAGTVTGAPLGVRLHLAGPDAALDTGAPAALPALGAPALPLVRGPLIDEPAGLSQLPVDARVVGWIDGAALLTDGAGGVFAWAPGPDSARIAGRTVPVGGSVYLGGRGDAIADVTDIDAVEWIDVRAVTRAGDALWLAAGDGGLWRVADDRSAHRVAPVRAPARGVCVDGGVTRTWSALHAPDHDHLLAVDEATGTLWLHRIAGSDLEISCAIGGGEAWAPSMWSFGPRVRILDDIVVGPTAGSAVTFGLLR